jgi:DNA-binding SARP family transcriptional activator
MRFRILGPLEVWDERGEVSLGGPKLRALLAVLLLHPNEVVPADRLIDELWGEDSPERAAAALRVNVSRLRKALPQDVLTTRSPGYLIRVEPDDLDLHRFERLVDEARGLSARGQAADASERVREALSLWRGAPLADFAYAGFAQTAIARLEEIRLAAVELRIDADLALGRHDELVGELEALVAEQPLRERLRRYLMTALYRSGRQAEALDAYRDARRALVEELGIEPSTELQELERAILRQEPALNLPANVPASAGEAAERSILVAITHERGLDALLAAVLAEAPCDVALLAPRDATPGGPVLVPFGGAEHDWAAVELGAWFARAFDATLRLAGAAAVPEHGRRDASRLLSHGALAVQRVVGISAEPLLVAPGEEGMLKASRDAGLLVVGLSTRWHREGLGPARLRLAREAIPPTLLVRRGLRPGGLAPPPALTRYTWSIRP